MRPSLIRSQLRKGEVVRITAMCYPSSMLPAHAANSGFHAVWLDAEHHTWDRREMQRMVALHHLANIDCIVRSGGRNPAELYHLLEDGATALMIPLVHSPAEADEIARAVKFPPLGRRGLEGGGLDNNFCLIDPSIYHPAANSETFLIIQIETPESINMIEDIAKLPAVDGLFMGPADLALRLNCALDMNHPKLVAAEDAIAAAAARHGIAWGRPAADSADVARIAAKGGRLIAHGSDFAAIMRMLPAYRAAFDSHTPG